jgi:hypothetical protein
VIYTILRAKRAWTRYRHRGPASATILVVGETDIVRMCTGFALTFLINLRSDLLECARANRRILRPRLPESAWIDLRDRSYERNPPWDSRTYDGVVICYDPHSPREDFELVWTRVRPSHLPILVVLQQLVTDEHSMGRMLCAVVARNSLFSPQGDSNRPF